MKEKEVKVLLEKSLNSPTARDISTTSDESPYRNRQSYGKAIKRGIEASSFSPRKKQAVMRGLASKAGLMLENTTSLKNN